MGNEEVYPIGPIRVAIARELGPELIRALHRPNLARDLWILIGWPAINVALVLAMAYLKLGPLWILCFVVQGIRLTYYLEISHDLLIHRRFGGRWLSSLLGVFYLAPVTYPFSGFYSSHLRHHHYLGTVRDPEHPIRNVKTRWQRLYFLTYPGFRQGVSGFTDPATRFTSGFTRRLSWERLYIRCYIASLIALSLFWHPFFFGYVLPYLVVSPVANALRVMLEHGEASVDNVYHFATFYQVGFVAGLIFPADIGERHIVHHLFPGIPMYRLGEAARALRPILLRQGVPPRRSFLELVRGYFIDAQPHWSLWRPRP